MCRWYNDLQKSKSDKILKIILKNQPCYNKTSEVFLNSYKKTKEKSGKSNRIPYTIPAIKLTRQYLEINLATRKKEDMTI